MEITDRQKQILEFIRSHIEQEGIAPSVREICSHFGLKGPAGVHRILKILERKGFLASSPGKKRTWRLTEKVSRIRGIPLLGQIAAGLPIDAVENHSEELPVDAAMFGCDSCFALYVKGDSMIDAHITDGDIAVIHACQDVDNGEIAAVLVDGLLPEATLKIVKKRKDGVELHAANPLYEPLVFVGTRASSVRILGRFAGLIRKTS
jgi:repressor LexA